MSDEADDLVKAAAQGAAEGFGKKIPPIYPDLLQPGVKQVGQAIGTILGVINLALAPVAQMIWNYETTQKWLQQDLAEKLKDVNEEDIITPKASIVGPAIESIKFLNDEPDLRAMFSQLIATSLNKNTSSIAHPGFVEIIKNLSKEDALILKYITEHHFLAFLRLYITSHDNRHTPYAVNHFFSLLSDSELNNADSGGLPNIGNLERLGLIVEPNSSMSEHQDYMEIIDSLAFKIFVENIDVKASGYHADERYVMLTPLGRKFCNACVR